MTGADCTDRRPGRALRRFERLAAGALAALTALCATWFALGLGRGFALETDLQALLPRSAGHTLAQLAGDRLFAQGGERLVLAVGAGDADTARRAADHILTALRQSPLVDADVLAPAAQAAAGERLLDTLWRHRAHLLGADQRTQLTAGSDALQERAVRELYAPLDWARPYPFEDDPLGLFAEFRRELPAGPAGTTLQGAHWVAQTPLAPGRHYVLLPAAMTASALALASQRRLVELVDDLARQVERDFAGADVLRSGIVFHADQAAQTARAEISLIGGGSALGIVVLFLLTFGSLRPLLLSLCSVAFGCWCAVTLCQWLFGGLHLLTLVFGASLTGVAIDYSLHYFTRLYSRHSPCGRQYALQAILPALTMGLATSVLGYGSLAQSSMPGLRQIACFSVAGLVGAWLFAVAAVPLAAARPHRPYPARLAQAAALPDRLWQRIGTARARRGLALGAVLCALTCAATLTPSRDVRTLYRPDPQLLQQEQLVSALVGNYSANQFFLITGDSAEQLLQREEALGDALPDLQRDGAIEGWSAVSQYLPSQRRQAENYALQEQAAYGGAGAAAPLLARLGFPDRAAAQLAQDFAAASDDYLLPEEWLAVAPSALRLLWLGEHQARWASMVTLRGVADLPALRTVAETVPGAAFVDRVAALSSLLTSQLSQAALLLVAAYGGVGLLLLARYRRCSALSLVAVPALSSLLTLTVLAVTGSPLTLFHVFALFLILGLGMDYGLFLADAGECDPDTQVAISLSALTSALSFGLLALSSTPMVQAFGVTVALGSALNLLLAPLLAPLLAARGERAPT